MKNIACILMIIMTSLTCLGQEKLEINVLNMPSTTSPGAHLNVIFEVKSLTILQEPILVSVGLPAYWQLLFKKEPQNQIGEQTLKYIYTVMTPKFAKSGSFSLIIYAKRKGGTIISKKISIDIVKIRKIEITPIIIPEYVKEGDTLKVDYLIQNLGNGQDAIRLESIEGQMENNQKNLLISPNESIKVTSKQIIKESDSNEYTIPFGIKAYLKDSLEPIQLINSIRVYSNKIKKKDPYLRFPINMGVWYTNYLYGNKNINGIQIDIQGKGFLDFKGKHFLDFAIHGPNNINIPILGSYDIYSLNYTYKNRTFVKLGDYSLQFNNLMEFGRFGRGLRIDNEFKKVGFSAFYIQPRFYAGQKTTFGGSFFLKPKPKLRFSVDYMSKFIVKKNREFWSNLLGVSAKFQGQKLNWEAEAVGNQVELTHDYGIFNRISLQLKRIQFHSDYIYSGKNFYGFYNNSYLLVNSLSFVITPKINVGLGNNITRINPSLDAINFNTSPYNTSRQAFASFQFRKSNVMLSYNQQEREDRFEPKSFHFKQDYTRIAYNLNASRVNIWYEGRYGTAKNLLKADDSAIQRESISNSLQPQVRLFPWIWVGGIAEHQRTSRFSANNNLNDLFFYGGSLRLLFAEKFNANFTYRNNYAPDELIENRSLIDLAVNLKIKNHTFNVAAGQTFIPNLSANFQKTTYFSLKYTLRINAPIAKNKNLGNIKGQILGLTNGIEKKGIIVKLGEKRYMTDENGIFYFNKLVPDRYFVEVDKSSIPFGVISSIRLPLEVNLKADSTKNIQIPLTKTGGIEGKVFFEDGVNIGSNYDEKPIILIKLFNEKENFITQLNEDGMFSFKEMKSGTWQMVATLAGNREGFTIVNANQTIDIAIDKIKKTEFVVRPVERRIEFMSKTFKLVDKQDNKAKKKPESTTTESKQNTQPIIKNTNATRPIASVKLFDSVNLNYLHRHETKFINAGDELRLQLQNRIVSRYSSKENIETKRTSSIKQTDAPTINVVAANGFQSIKIK